MQTQRQIAVLSVVVVILTLSSAGFAAPQVLEVSPTYLEFSAYVGGANPANQIVSIWNSGHGPMGWTVTEDCNWMVVDPNSGTSSGEVDDASVIVDISGMAAGTYNCQLTVDAGGAANSPQIVDVNLIIYQPVIGLSAVEFEFYAIEGGANPADQILSISNIGGGTLNWEITEDCSWLQVDPNTGSSTGETNDVTISVDITGLARGTYDCNLMISDPNAANSPQTVGVTLSISTEGIWVNPTSFAVNIIEGCILTETLTIGNDGAEDLDFVIRTRQVGSSGGSAESIVHTSTAGEGGTSSVNQIRDFTVVGDAPYTPGELIVRFASKASGKVRSTADKNQILAAVGGGTIKRDFKIVPSLSVVELPEGITVEEALPMFNNVDDILYAEPDYEVHACSTIPDDTRFDELWGMHNTGQTGGTEDADIDAPEAWDIGTGSSDIIVAVIDTGVDYTHVDLAANMWVNEAEFNGTPGVDDDGNGYVDDIYGYDFRNNDGNPMDDHYHGTHCAGTIGAVGNNSEGVAGVCWDVRIMAIKFLSSGGSGTTADAIDSVEYATLMGANLSSNSWGGGGYSQGLKDAIDAAGAAGMLFAAAAGNDNENTDVHPHYPSSYDCESLISIMSTNQNDNKSGFSNYGSISVDLGAPGSDILSCQLGGGYKYASGTSMATPHVAGACALLWSMDQEISNAEVKDILLRTVDPTLSGLCVSEGRLNLYNAILETKARWIEIVPEEGIISPSGSIDISVTFDAIEMAPGNYEAKIVVISNDTSNPTIIIPVTMTVKPDDLVVLPDEDFESSGTKGGPFKPECMTYTLTNNGTASVNWTTAKAESWLRVTPVVGILDPNNSIEVNVCIDPNADLLDPNIYTDRVIFQNADSNSIKPRLVTLAVKPPDCFTESFDERNDLDFLSLTFSPDGSVAYYEACREKTRGFPTDPNGGTYVPLGDDDFAEVVLSGGAEILFYGQSYDRFYIGSNGYITFIDGDAQFLPSLENHFSMPRISAVFADLTPPDTQCISWKQLEDGVVVTYEDVPLYGDKLATNSFQVEMFFADGTICITWLDAAAASRVVGLSEGKGLPVFFKESDLSKYIPCWSWGDFDRDYSVNFTDFAVLAMHWLDEGCGIPYWCGRTDLNFSGIVEVGDVGIFAENWLTKNDWWLEPVSHWKFDEGSGIVAYDSAGTNHGTVHGAVWTTGQIDGALSFDGINDYVEVPDDESLDFGIGSFSIAAWIKVEGDTPPSSSAHTIVGKRKPTGNKNQFQFSVVDVGRKLRLHTSDGSASQVTGVTTIKNYNWYHVAGIRDSNGIMELYVNGLLDNSTSFPVRDVDSDAFLGIGTHSTQGVNYFNGLIDDVRIYDRALSAQEIQQLYRERPRKKAFNPNPVDQETGVDPNVVLSWSPGKDALSHDVYFGTDYNDVNDATTDSAVYMGNQDVNFYDPCSLDLETTYYWRIDEVGDPNLWKGDVWSFTTWDEFGPGFVSWWKFDEGAGAIAYDTVGGNDGTIYGAIWTGGQIDGALSFDGIDDYVEVADDDSLDFGTGSFSIAAWIKVEGDTPPSSSAHTIVGKRKPTGNKNQFQFSVVDVSRKLRLHTSDGFASQINGVTTISDGNWYHVAGIRDSNGMMELYVNGLLDNSTSLPVRDVDNDAFLGIGTHSTQGVNYFNGLIDDVRIYDRALSAQEIQQLYRERPRKKAFNPNPVDQETDVDPNLVLSWSPGEDAKFHDVYLSTSFSDVNDANTSSDPNIYRGRQTLEANSYDPCGLDIDTTYYWRIDEVNEPNLWKGGVWSFTTTVSSDPNFISWWKFDEGSGSTAYDWVGSNHGTVYGAVWTAGQIDGALDFDGSNDYVRVPDNDSLDFGTGSFSIAAWIKIEGDTDPGSSAHTIVGKRKPTGDKNQFQFCVVDVGRKLRLHTSDSSVSQINGVATISDGNWYHVAAVRNSNGMMELYVDGFPDNSVSLTVRDVDSDAFLGIGTHSTQGLNYLNGKIDDVRIYDRVLSGGEIWQLYQDGL